MSDVATTNGNAVANVNNDPFAQYAEAAGSNRIIGSLLKFNKGDWLVGQDEEELSVGTKLVADMNSLTVGWVRWQDGKPAEQRLSKLIDQLPQPRREDLGFDDESEWETDSEDRPKDPWQFTNYLILKDVDGEELYTLAANSKGAVQAIAGLCGDYARGRRQQSNKLPIIELGVDSYKHKNKDYGRVKVPKFKIVGWADPEGFQEAVEAASKETEEEQGDMLTPSGGTRF